MRPLKKQDLDLIDFYNNHFYNNKLKLLPEFKEINDRIPRIDFIETSGIGKDNQNLVEAHKVKDLVLDLNLNAPNKSIGVVTFNFQQAVLIQDLCPDMKNLIVENIENFQDDEFDILFFSIA